MDRALVLLACSVWIAAALLGWPAVAKASSSVPQDMALALDQGRVGDTAFPTDRFAAPSGAIPPVRSVGGELRIGGERADHFTLLRDSLKSSPFEPGMRELPQVRIALVSQGDAVLPVQRTPIETGNRYFDWIFGPGRAWSLPGEPDATYVALPFSLMEVNANCLHNGLALFRLDASGKASQLVYQIGSETCAYLQFDLWGAMPVAFVEGEPAQAGAVRAAYRREVAQRPAIRSIAAIGAQADAFGSAREVSPEALTTYGVVLQGSLYAGPCPTRYGPYPYCDALDLPSYSWAKSLVAGIGAMRLEKLFPGAMDARIADYVPECSGPDWRVVTFRDALDMATGHYASATYDEDESSDAMWTFLGAPTHAQKIQIACHAFARKEAPGKTFVYHTSDTYILGVAMAAYLRSHVKGNPDLYTNLLVPIWHALGLSPVMDATRRTRDEAHQPFTGWGLVLQRGDIALLADFLQRGGTIGGQALLDPAMLAEALQRDPRHRGLPAIDAGTRYNHGFWAWNAGPALRCQNDAWVPALSGYGGLTLALMPDGISYFYVSDGYQFAWSRAAQGADRMAAFCL